MGIKQSASMKAKRPSKPTGVKGSRNAAERRASAATKTGTPRKGYAKRK